MIPDDSKLFDYYLQQLNKGCFADFGVIKGCKNLAETYGETCVHCNKCGRFDNHPYFIKKKKQKEERQRKKKDKWEQMKLNNPMYEH